MSEQEPTRQIIGDAFLDTMLLPAIETDNIKHVEDVIQLSYLYLQQNPHLVDQFHFIYSLSEALSRLNKPDGSQSLRIAYDLLYDVLFGIESIEAL